MTSKASCWAAEKQSSVNYEATRKSTIGSIPVANVSVLDVWKRNLKRSAIEIMVDKTKCPREEMEATISTAGDPQSMADIGEVVVTLTGQRLWSGGCATSKIEFDDLKRKIGLIRARVTISVRKIDLIRARDTISEVVDVIYDNIEFEHDGHFISNYGDVYALRKLLRSLKKDDSGLNKAIITSVAKFLQIEASVAGPAFDVICNLRLSSSRYVHCPPNFVAAKSAIKFYCTNSSDIPFEQKDYIENCFLLFAEKTGGLKQETVHYGNAWAEPDLQLN